MSIEVVTSYTWDGSFRLDGVAHNAVGRVSDFSGAGFGERDLGWIAKSEFDAERMKRALEKIGLHAKVRMA